MTYHLTDLNRSQLAWFIAEVSRTPVAEIRAYFAELENDSELHQHLIGARLADPQWRLSDPEPRFGRRLGWYALVRALRPDHVVETGTDKGLGSMVLAAALLTNGSGRLTTIDVQPRAGYLIGGKWAEIIDCRHGDSLEIIPRIGTIDVFLHDSLHTVEHENGEYDRVAGQLSGHGVLLSDAAHHTDALMQWAEANDRRYAYFQDHPAEHWYRGAGIGIAYRAR